MVVARRWWRARSALRRTPRSRRPAPPLEGGRRAGAALRSRPRPSAAAVAALGGELRFALGLGEFFAAARKSVSSRRVVGRPERLEAVDHAGVEVRHLVDLAGGAGARRRGRSPSAALASAQIASPCEISSALVERRVGRRRRSPTGVDAVESSPPPPPQPAMRQSARAARIAIAGSYRASSCEGENGSRAIQTPGAGGNSETAPQGLEPRIPRPERGVLPLHQGATMRL